MRHILIATHGSLASALRESAEMICGEKEHVTCINFYTEPVDYESIIRTYMSRHGEGDETVICVDMFFGSVGQKFLPYLSKAGVHMIAGINLPVLLELMMHDEPLTTEALEELIALGHEQLYRVNLEQLSTNNGEDFY